jgi:hypothetical protein
MQDNRLIEPPRRSIHGESRKVLCVLKVSAVYKEWMWLIPLLLLVTWLGARGLNADPIWFDEWWSIYHAGGAHYGPLSPADTWMRVAQEDPRNTPGYYLGLQAWGLFTGWTPFAGRALSLFIGLLAVAWMYRLGRDLISSSAGIGAATVVGTGTFFTYYLHELRAYTLYVLLTAVCVGSYWRIIAGKAGWRAQAAFFLSMVGLWYTHYFAGLTAASLGLYHVLFARKSARWRRVVTLMLLAGLTFLPWLAVLSEIVGFFQETGVTAQFALDTRSAAQNTLYLFSNGSIGLSAFFALVGLRSTRRAPIFIWFWGLSALVIALAVNEWLNVILNVRYLMALWPALALIVGLGVDHLSRRGIPLVLILSVWIISGVWNTFDPTSLKEIKDTPYYLPWNTLRDSIRDYVQTNDQVLFLLPDQRPLRRSVHEPVADYYLHRLPIRYGLLESPRLLGEARYERLATEYLENAHRVWVAYDPAKMPDHVRALDQILINSHILCGTFEDSPELHLNLYGRLPTAGEGEGLQFGDAIRGEPLPPFTITEGRLNVLVTWKVENTVPDNSYSVALHLEDMDGNLVAQADYGLPVEGYTCHASDLDVNGLPPGDYTLMVGIYDRFTGERLPALNVTSGETGDRLRLGTVTIRP